MSQFSLSQCVSMTAEQQEQSLAEINLRLEMMDAHQRVNWALENLPGEFVLSSSFGIQAAVCLHLVTQEYRDIPVILTDTGYLFPETYQFLDKL
ncbi:phosphoadenosine phosphosulfate reductase family protein, partial [Enterobacter hormaechei]|nr:phosphoadenosine phosphosulfate reductase family protein [Enterobacter hormaechei]